MSKTSLSDSNSNLCRDYSSFVKWAIDKISKNTDKWTDYTVSEPETLMLSSIATMHDYAQYIIDQTYLNTDIDVCTTRFLHQVSAAMGKYLSGTNSIQIPIQIINNSENTITIEPYEVFTYGNELFTNPDEIIIPPGLMAESYVVRNTVNEMIYKIDKNSNGEFLLRGSVETSSVSVYGISSDSSQVELTSCDYIFDLLYADSNSYKYLVTSIDNDVLRIKISPSTFQNFDALLVKYVIIDDYPIRENLQLNLLSDSNDLQITTISAVSIDSDIPINSEKLTYLNSLTNIRTLCNKPYSLDLGELNKRIENHRLIYEPSPTRRSLPLFEYTTFDNAALNGSDVPPGIEYFNLSTGDTFFNKNNRLLQISFNSIPVYDLIVTYNTDIEITIPNRTLRQLLNSSKIITVTLENYKENNSVYVGFKNLGNFIKFEINNNFIAFPDQTEFSLLTEKFINNILIEHELPVFKFLSQYILSLDSTIILSKNVNHLEIINKITTLLYEILVNGEIISGIKGSYRRLEILIQNNIPEIYKITFTKNSYTLSSSQHLVIDSPENYLNSGNIEFRNREDEMK